MVLQQLNIAEQPQRIGVEMESQPTGKRVKVRIESYDEHLGWYTSASLMLPLHQLPLLEQAIADLRGGQSFCDDAADAKIIPFPTAAINSVS